MGFPDRIERTMEIAHPPTTVWAALTTATDLAGRLPITRQAIAKHLALLAEAGLVRAEPGEPMQVAQQFLAALARDWDGTLGALTDHLDRSAHGPTPTPLHATRAHHG